MHKYLLRSESINIIDETLKNKMINDSKTEVIFIKIPYYSQMQKKTVKKRFRWDKNIRKIEKNQFKFIDFKPIFCSMNNRNKIFLSFDASHLANLAQNNRRNLDKF